MSEFSRIVSAAAAALAFSVAAAASPTEAELVGTWEWVHTTLPHDGGQDDPSTVGYTESLQLHPDGSYTRFRDAMAIASGTWSITAMEVCSVSPSITISGFYLGQLMQLFYTENRLNTGFDYLTFGLLCAELSNHTYRRRSVVPINSESWSRARIPFLRD